MLTLILFTTEGCHLCERAIDEIELCVNDYEFSLQELDIATDESLVRHYGTRIPTLYIPETKSELSWPFDHFQVLEFINKTYSHL